MSYSGFGAGRIKRQVQISLRVWIFSWVLYYHSKLPTAISVFVRKALEGANQFYRAKKKKLKNCLTGSRAISYSIIKGLTLQREQKYEERQWSYAVIFTKCGITGLSPKISEALNNISGEINKNHPLNLCLETKQ